MKWPWRQYPEPDVEGDTGGREARERAEEALREVRMRRAQQAGMRLWFRQDAAENHYGKDVETVFRGGKPA